MGADLNTLTGSSATGLRVEVEELPRWRRRLSLVVPPARVREERSRVTRDYAKRLRLPGFRPGRAPADVVRQRFRSDIEQDLVRALLQTAVQEAVEEHRLEPITPPVVRSLDLDPDDTLRATAEIEIRPRPTLGRYRDFALERPPATVPPGALEQVLQRLREERAELRPLERPAARGDVVSIEVTPADGETGAPQSFELALGSGRADPGVEEQLEGARAGEERLIVLEGAPAPGIVSPGMPDVAGETAQVGTEAAQPTSEPLAGPRRFRVRIREVKERILPALDDAFAAAVASVSSLAELHELLTANLAAEAEARAERELRDRLLDAIADANAVEVPESMVESYVERMLHPSETGAPGGRDTHEHGRTHAHGHAHAPHEHGHDHEPAGADAEHDRLAEILHPAAERGLRRHLVLDAVARAENLDPTEEQIDAYLGERIAEGTQVRDARLALERKGQLEDLRHHLRTENVFAYLKSQSTIRSAEGSAPAEPAG